MEPSRYGAARRLSKTTLAFLLLVTPVAAEPTELVALGDSLTQGFGLAPEDGFVPQLTKWLVARGHDVTIMNAGVSGDTTAGGLSRAAWSLTDNTDGMIVALGGNDLLRGLDPTVSRENLNGILSVAAEADVSVMLVGMQAPGNYGPDYKTRFDAMYPDLAQTWNTILAPSFFEGVSDGEVTPETVRAYFQADGIHPNAAGVLKIVDALGPRVEQLLEKIAEARD